MQILSKFGESGSGNKTDWASHARRKYVHVGSSSAIPAADGLLFLFPLLAFESLFKQKIMPVSLTDWH